MNNEPIPMPMNMEGMNPNMNPVMINQMNQMMMSQMMGANGMRFIYSFILKETEILLKAMVLSSFPLKA